MKRALKQKYALLRPDLMMKLSYLQTEARVIYSPVDDTCRQTIGTHFGQGNWLGIISRLKRNTPRAELEAVGEFFPYDGIGGVIRQVPRRIRRAALKIMRARVISRLPS